MNDDKPLKDFALLHENYLKHLEDTSSNAQKKDKSDARIIKEALSPHSELIQRTIRETVTGLHEHVNNMDRLQVKTVLKHMQAPYGRRQNVEDLRIILKKHIDDMFKDALTALEEDPKGYKKLRIMTSEQMKKAKDIFGGVFSAIISIFLAYLCWHVLCALLARSVGHPIYKVIMRDGFPVRLYHDISFKTLLNFIKSGPLNTTQRLYYVIALKVMSVISFLFARRTIYNALRYFGKIEDPDKIISELSSPKLSDIVMGNRTENADTYSTMKELCRKRAKDHCVTSEGFCYYDEMRQRCSPSAKVYYKYKVREGGKEENASRTENDGGKE